MTDQYRGPLDGSFGTAPQAGAYGDPPGAATPAPSWLHSPDHPHHRPEPRSRTAVRTVNLVAILALTAGVVAIVTSSDDEATRVETVSTVDDDGQPEVITDPEELVVEGEPGDDGAAGAVPPGDGAVGGDTAGAPQPDGTAGQEGPDPSAGVDGTVPAEAGAEPEGPVDLRSGAVFALSNDGMANEVVAFSRAPNGRLAEVGRYDTGGTGSGSFEDAAQGLVLGSSEGEVAPIHNIDDAELLFVTNAGSNSISVFRVLADGLELVDVEPSGGEKPVSITVNSGLVYVLNSGEFDNRLASSPEDGLVNCTTGQLPSVTGFRVTPEGELTQIHGSTRLLTGEAESGCAQVSFTPDGGTLIVTERIAGRPGPEPPGDTAKGAILSFPVRDDGQLGTATVNEPLGNGPFGFTFTRSGVMLMTEQNGAFDNFGGGTVASYEIAPPGAVPDAFLNAPDMIQSVSPSSDIVPSFSTDPCWIVVTNDQRLAIVSSALGTLSTFAVSVTGEMSLLHVAATSASGNDSVKDYLGFGLTDITLSADSQYVYALHSFEGKIYTFRVNPNGLLTFVEQHEVFDLSTYVRNEGAPYGIAAF